MSCFYFVCFHISSSRVYFLYKCIYNLTFSEYVNCFCLVVVVIVGMITFNNLCLKLVEVSFYNVARSLTIVFNVFFSRVFLGIPTSFKTALCLGVVIVGFVMGSHGELNFNLAGTLSGIMSSLFVSLNSIFTKKILPVVDDNHWRLTFYNNVNAIFLFIPLIIYQLIFAESPHNTPHLHTINYHSLITYIIIETHSYYHHVTYKHMHTSPMMGIQSIYHLTNQRINQLPITFFQHIVY